MPKSNRKGYFLNQLKVEGVQQSPEASLTKKRGQRKEPKIAAREARERKKIYIDYLEQRAAQQAAQIQMLKTEMSLVKEQNKQLKQKISKYSYSQNKRNANGQTNDVEGQRAFRFDGLLKEIKNLSAHIQERNNQEVGRSLSVLRDKFGISGRQRLKNVDQLFEKIIGIMMPLHYRLLMQHCENSRSFYSLLGNQFTNQNIVKLQEKIKEILISFRPQIIKQREQYDRLLVSLAEIRTRIKGQNYKCQGIVDEMEDKLDPIFVGKLLLDLDFCRSKQNLENIYPINYWNQNKDEPVDGNFPPTRIENYFSEIKSPVYRFQEDIQILDQLFS